MRLKSPEKESYYMPKNTIVMTITKRHKVILSIVAGAIVGGVLLVCYLLRAHTYLTDEPSACVNCHIMSPYYASWMHSSHGRDATCNDCHVPQENFVKKWAFKGLDGVKHVAAFVTNGERQVIQAHPMSSQVIMNNCIRCHEQLNTEFVNTGKLDYMTLQTQNGMACWDCHRDVPHGRNSLSSIPNSIVPYPESPLPEWLREIKK